MQVLWCNFEKLSRGTGRLFPLAFSGLSAGLFRLFATLHCFSLHFTAFRYTSLLSTINTSYLHQNTKQMAKNITSLSEKILLLEDITPYIYGGVNYYDFPEPMKALWRKQHLTEVASAPAKKQCKEEPLIFSGRTAVDRYVWELQNMPHIPRQIAEHHTDPSFHEAFGIFKRNKKGGGAKHLQNCLEQWDKFAMLRICEQPVIKHKFIRLYTKVQ